MDYTTLVSAQDTLEHLEDPNWRIIDCQFDLKDKSHGYQSYRKEHIPSAIYADLENDLSSPISANSGRHPLPAVSDICEKFSKWGIQTNTQVIVYDNVFGSYAARLWWLLKWLGHRKVAVLNGGLTFWKQAGYPLTSKMPTVNPVDFSAQPNMSMMVDTNYIANTLSTSVLTLIDVRDSERYKGLQEPIDKAAGHIPGAINIPWKTNLDQNGLYLNSSQLQTQYQEILKNQESQNLVFMCGSGVSACHSLVALENIGISHTKLYPGSWSEWIQDASRPIETSF